MNLNKFGSKWAISQEGFVSIAERFSKKDQNGLTNALKDISKIFTETPILYSYNSETAKPLQKLSMEVTEALINSATLDTDNTDFIMVIPVKGVVVRDADELEEYFFGLTSMSKVGKLIKSAIESPNLKGIVLDFDTPGGTVDGTKELSDTIVNIGKKIPIVALAANATSAGAWLTSSCNSIIARDSMGNFGSIGVMTTHASFGRMYKNYGIDLKLLSAKESTEKLIGRSDRELTSEDETKIVEDLGQTLNIFKKEMTKLRPNIDTELFNAKVVSATEASKKGLIDKIARKGNGMDLAINEVKKLYKAMNGSDSSISTSNNKSNNKNINQNKTMEFKNLNLEAHDASDDILSTVIEDTDKYVVVKKEDMIALDESLSSDKQNAKMAEYDQLLVDAATEKVSLSETIESLQTANNENKEVIETLQTSVTDLQAAQATSEEKITELTNSLAEAHASLESKEEEYTELYEKADSAGILTPKAKIDVPSSINKDEDEDHEEKTFTSNDKNVNWALSILRNSEQEKVA